MVFQTARQHVLRTGKKHLLAVKREEIRALPHLSHVMIVLHKRLHEVPVHAVFTSIQKHLAAVPRVLIGDHNTVRAVLLDPELRISEGIRVSTLRQIFARNNRVFGIFDIIVAIAKSQTLRLHFLLYPVFIVDQLTPCIHEHLSSIRKCQCAAGITTVSIIRPVRRHRRRQIAPVDQVFAHRVSPVHGTPMRVVGMILIKHMILAVIIGKPVGVVHPSYAC